MRTIKLLAILAALALFGCDDGGSVAPPVTDCGCDSVTFRCPAKRRCVFAADSCGVKHHHGK